MELCSKKIQIRHMSDYANLFLACYASRKLNDDNLLYLSPNFRTILEVIFKNLNIDEYEYHTNLLNENKLFDFESFLDKLNVSSVKKYWRNDYVFDLKKNIITIHVDKKTVEDKICEYCKSDVQYMYTIVDYYNQIEQYLNSCYESNIKEKINLLVLKSND